MLLSGGEDIPPGGSGPATVTAVAFAAPGPTPYHLEYSPSEASHRMPTNPVFAEFLCRSRLGLDAVSASALAAQMWPSALAPGDYLFHQGQPTDRFCMVYEGSCDVITTSLSGKELIFTTLTAGEPIGEASILDGVPRTASIRGKTHATILSIDRASFLSLAETHGAIALSLARLSARTLRRLSSRVENDTFTDLGSRLTALLLELAAPPATNGTRSAKITQQTLADRLGVTRESINKYLRGWADAGHVELRRGVVVVVDPHSFATAVHS